jgi:hypothetical protein
VDESEANVNMMRFGERVCGAEEIGTYCNQASGTYANKQNIEKK